MKRARREVGVGGSVAAVPTVRRAWRPLIDGDLRARANDAVDALAGALADPQAASDDFSLARGSAGLALFYSYLAEARADDRWRAVAEAHLRRSMKALATTRMGGGLYEGFTGIAWAIEHLAGRVFDPQDDRLGAVDDALLRHAERSPWTRSYDLIFGLVGIGVYALERHPRPSGAALVERVLDRLLEMAEVTDAGTTWVSPAEWVAAPWRDKYPEREYNLGVAHGVPAVVGFLGAACAAGIDRDRAGRLLEEVVSWVLGQRVDDPYSCFPPSAVPGEDPRPPARSAWCYGDPGVAVTLLGAARAVDKAEWKREAVMIARRNGARPLEEARVVDATICHGAAGLAHLFNRMSFIDADAELEQVARMWIQRVLDMRVQSEGIAGFAHRLTLPEGDVRWDPDPGFLTGGAGIGLVLLAAASEVEPEWDRVLLASHRSNEGVLRG